MSTGLLEAVKTCAKRASDLSVPAPLSAP